MASDYWSHGSVGINPRAQLRVSDRKIPGEAFSKKAGLVKVFLPVVGVWNEMSFAFPPSPNHSVTQ